MGRVDGAVVAIRAWIDRRLPWYDEKAAARSHKAVAQVIRESERVIADGRTESMRDGYRRSGRAIARR